MSPPRAMGRLTVRRDGRERGAALLTVLLMVTLIALITLMVMAITNADLAAGIRQQQAVQVFNVAEAGVHYAMARLQTAGADTYTGETVPITDGSVPLGQAVVVVRCLNGSSPNPGACAGAQPAFRRITSTGTLAAAGPARVVTAIVEGTTSATSSFAVCGYDGVNLDQGVRIYGDVGSNAALTLARGGTPSRICDSLAGGACPAPSITPPFPYTGSAYAVGTITCGGGACNSTQIEGTIAPNQPAGSVCPAVTLSPPSAPGTTPLNVGPGATVTLDPAVNYGRVTLASTGTASCPANVNDRATLIINSGTDPNGTVTVRMRSLWVGKCARVVITGSGRVVLWLLEPATSPASAAGQALHAEQLSIFGSTATGATPAAIEGNRFTINVVSSKPLGDPGDCLDAGVSACAAVSFNQSGLIAGTFVIPEGGYQLDQAQLTNGAILARRIQFDRNTTFTYDPRSSIGGGTYSNFDRLRAWKDQ
ncbi:MAG: hypothetical protein QN174_09110 [Armatimonadota bacterium]|nr:hypothetical protein [Armatimonadota bacterium]MDR7453245.1 hypothetical protein [Armatimonadota bacterium]MDR7455861.1 hypothetical protein [Armatimonadota bacterium]MDR7497102.1 hypothetical protein [Armatimonadota bacterium]MDR7511908.1 hypothetical protein [Armatimonadota bacterium]